MTPSPCPACHTLIPAPTITGTAAPERIPSHATADCPVCGVHLIYTVEGKLAHKWRLDRARA